MQMAGLARSLWQVVDYPPEDAPLVEERSLGKSV